MKKKGIISTCIILAVAIACAAIAGNSFYQKRNFKEDIVTEGTAVTRTYKLSTYNKNLKGERLFGGGNHDWSHAYIAK